MTDPLLPRTSHLEPRTSILSPLDTDRRAAGELHSPGDVVKQYFADGSYCCIVYSRCQQGELDEVIQREIALAKERKYALEWKVYGHDPPGNLGERLVAAGFEPGPLESVMVLPLSEAALTAFAAPAHDIRRVADMSGLNDMASIARETGRTNVEEEINEFAQLLRDTPEKMSLYVAYSQGEPVACGRTDFNPNSPFAGLYGGRTKTTFRNRGFYTALVATRLREALDRKRQFALVDALPTSEPILRKRGFLFATTTQPFKYHGRLMSIQQSRILTV